MLLPRYRAITITGTRAVHGIEKHSVYDLFEDTIAKYNTAGTSWFVGGAMGIDTWALDWLRMFNKGTVTIVVPKTVNDQPTAARIAINKALTQKTFSLVELKHKNPMSDSEVFYARNRFMVDRSDATIGYPHKTKKSFGTRYTINYSLDCGKITQSYPIG